MPKTEQKRVIPNKKEVNKDFLSVIFGNEFIEKDLTPKEEEKLALFEKGLCNAVNKKDTIDTAIEKIVKTALACEFGPSFVLQNGSEKMVKTIARGISSDPELRKQALIIIDKFAHAPKHICLPPMGEYN